MNIPLIVAAYNRPKALSRLLASLQKAVYPGTVKLIISIDGGGDEKVLKIAEAFEWPFGEKKIIRHDEDLGLRRHILSCGEISQAHDGIILLEDDLYVSPQFYNYARLAMDFYSQDNAIAGIALYAHSFNETAGFPFYPLLDEADVFFMQLACSWGQCWTKNQWALFKGWLKQKGEQATSAPPKNLMLPGDIALWPETSWKKYFTLYMIEKNLFFVYPRTSYTTNFGDAGQHQNSVKNFQVPLQYGKKTPTFGKIADSFAIYDAFCEITPGCLNKLAKDLAQYDYCVDLYGTKRISSIADEYILTPKKNRQALSTFGRELLPIEANIIENIQGKRLFFTKTEDCIDTGSSERLRKRMINPKEEILYHYNLPERYIKRLKIMPARFLKHLFQK